MSEAKKSVDLEHVQSTEIERPKTKFCSMDDDCISLVMDWLSIEELCKLKVTCKRLYLLANEHYKRTYLNERNLEYKYLKSFSLGERALVYNEKKNIIDLCRELKEDVKYIICLIPWVNFDSNLSDEHSKRKLK